MGFSRQEHWSGLPLPLESTLPPTQESGRTDSGGGVPANLRGPSHGWGEACLPLRISAGSSLEHTQEQAALVMAEEHYTAISEECEPLRPLNPSPSLSLLKSKL